MTDSTDHSESQLTVYRAKWVCTADQPPIANGAVTVDEHQILSVGPFSSAFESVSAARCQIVDLGDGAIIPGLVNSHTHLEFSDLQTPLGQPGIEFTDWIRLIVARRHESNRTSDQGELSKKKSAAIKQGIDESFSSGVHAIGEITTMPFDLGDYRHGRQRNGQPNMFLMCYLEQLGRDVSALDQKRDELTSFLNQQSDPESSLSRLGASPHAPYSVAPSLLRQMCQQSNSAGRRVAMHLAETMTERELLDHQTGEFVALLQELGVWDRESFENGLSIVEVLQLLATSHAALIVHGNYLNENELDFVAANRDKMSIAFCPRTHHFFGHVEYPLLDMLKRKINVCLGTDSRASNPDLDLLNEAKHVSHSFPQLDPQLILQMATLNGATALGVSRSHGSITPGKNPALAYVTEAGSDNSPFDWLFDPESTCSPLLGTVPT